jgi:hypothetical protein
VVLFAFDNHFMRYTRIKLHHGKRYKLPVAMKDNAGDMPKVPKMPCVIPSA